MDLTFAHYRKPPLHVSDYTDGEAWRKFTGFDQIVKHMVAAPEDVLRIIRV